MKDFNTHLSRKDGEREEMISAAKNAKSAKMERECVAASPLSVFSPLRSLRSLRRKSSPLSLFFFAVSAFFAANLYAFTPVRPLAQLGEQDPDAVVARAPESAQVVLPARYVKPLRSEIVNLASLTNALWNGQILLQRELATEREGAAFVRAALAETEAQLADLRTAYDAATARAARLDALRAWLIEQRDAAKLPTTKALYQAILDRLDEDIKGAKESATSLAS